MRRNLQWKMLSNGRPTWPALHREPGQIEQQNKARDCGWSECRSDEPRIMSTRLVLIKQHSHLHLRHAKACTSMVSVYSVNEPHAFVRVVWACNNAQYDTQTRVTLVKVTHARERWDNTPWEHIRVRFEEKMGTDTTFRAVHVSTADTCMHRCIWSPHAPLTGAHILPRPTLSSPALANQAPCTAAQKIHLLSLHHNYDNDYHK